MLNLQKTTDLVKRQLESDLYLMELLKDDLVNVSGLARMLLPKVKRENPKATVESIAIATKRYVAEQKKERLSAAVRGIIARSQLSTKNDVVHLTFKRNTFVSKKIAEVSNKVKWEDDEIFFINQGLGEITVILDRKNVGLLDACRDYQIETTPDLTIISIKEHLEKAKSRSIDVPGIYAYFINRLARSGVNIISVVSTYTQITFAFAKEDFLKAYGMLEDSIAFFRE